MKNLSGLLIDMKDLSEDQLVHFKHAVESVLDAAPCDAHISGLLRKTKEGYLGALRVISCNGIFKVSVREKNLQKAFSTLIERIEGRLLEWKRERILTA